MIYIEMMCIRMKYYFIKILLLLLLQALVEQVVYSPIAISGFYLGLGLLEGKSWEEAKAELLEKFIPTYKVSFLALGLYTRLI